MFGIVKAECEICEADYYPKDMAQDYFICLDYNYMIARQPYSAVPADAPYGLTLQNDDTVIKNCARFVYREVVAGNYQYVCTSCKFPYYLETASTTAICVLCGAAESGIIQSWDVTGQVLDLDSNHQTCVAEEANFPNCKTLATTLESIQAGTVVLACTECKDNFYSLLGISAVTFGNLNTQFNPTDSINTITDPTQTYPVMTCTGMELSAGGSANTLHGDFDDQSTYKFIPNCKHYKVLDVATNIGCAVCKLGFHGKVAT